MKSKKVALLCIGLVGLSGCATGLSPTVTDTANLRSLPRPRSGATFDRQVSLPSAQEVARERFLNPAQCLGDGACSQ